MTTLPSPAPTPRRSWLAAVAGAAASTTRPALAKAALGVISARAALGALGTGAAGAARAAAPFFLTDEKNDALKAVGSPLVTVYSPGFPVGVTFTFVGA